MCLEIIVMPMNIAHIENRETMDAIIKKQLNYFYRRLFFFRNMVFNFLNLFER